MKSSIIIKCFRVIIIYSVFFTTNGNAAVKDSVQTNPKYEECTHPGKYEPIGVFASCCTGKTDWTFSYSYMNMYCKGNQMGTDKASDQMVFQQYGYMMAPNTMNMQMHMLMVMYGISSRFSAMAMAGYNINTMTMNGIPDNMMHAMTGMPSGTMYMPAATKTSGIGDTKVYLLYKLFQECHYNVIVGGGINIPTGSTTLNGSNMLGDNQRLAYPMQLGTGTWNILPSITYFGQRNITDKNILSYGIETKADIKPANNSLGYSYGNQYNLSAWVSYKLYNWISCSARIEGISQDKISGFDPAVYPLMYNDPSANPENFGGKWLNTYLGLNFYINKTAFKDLRFLVEYGMPVYQNLNGTQMTINSTLQAGCKYSF